MFPLDYAHVCARTNLFKLSAQRKKCAERFYEELEAQKKIGAYERKSSRGFSRDNPVSV